MENNYFYCYSNKLHYFLISMSFIYVTSGVNGNTNKQYWTYDKSNKLDDAIELYNSIKYKFR